MLQPRIHNDLIRLEPLRDGDFEALFRVASDPLIWEQHPNPNRYQRDVFQNYFDGALKSGGASCVFDHVTGEVLGSSRYYDLSAADGRICIGYTFIARSVWGRGYNYALKSLMLDHAFLFVDRVLFHVGAANMRSRRAMEKLGGANIGEETVAYFGERSHLNVLYEIRRADWQRYSVRTNSASERPVIP